MAFSRFWAVSVQILVGPDGEVGVGLTAAAAHPAPDLVQLAQAEMIRVKNDQRVGLGHVQPAFHDGGAQQHVVGPGVEVQHHVLQRVFPHLAMGHADAGLRHQRLYALAHLLDGAHPII